MAGNLWVEPVWGQRPRAQRVATSGLLIQPGYSFSTTGPGGGGSGNTAVIGANEPAGFTQLTSRAFNTVGAGGTEGWSTEETLSTHFDVVSMTTAPHSPNNIARITYPSDWVGGDGIVAAQKDLPASKTQCYTAAWVMFSDNWVGHSSNVNKIWLQWIHDNPSFVVVAEGIGAGTLTPMLKTQNVPDPTDRWVPNIVSNASITRGRWTLWETLVIGNTAGVADGTAKLWIDNTLVTSYTTVEYADTGQANT